MGPISPEEIQQGAAAARAAGVPPEYAYQAVHYYPTNSPQEIQIREWIDSDISYEPARELLQGTVSVGGGLINGVVDLVSDTAKFIGWTMAYIRDPYASLSTPLYEAIHDPAAASHAMELLQKALAEALDEKDWEAGDKVRSVAYTLTSIILFPTLLAKLGKLGIAARTAHELRPGDIILYELNESGNRYVERFAEGTGRIHEVASTTAAYQRDLTNYMLSLIHI